MGKTVPKSNAQRAAPSTQKRIFIVDDHPVFREGLVGLVRREADLVVCGEADGAPQALAGIERLKPDLLLADIGLAGRSGLELLKDVRAIDPDLSVLVISMHDETLYAERALRAGARGYIMKQEPPEKMIEAIRMVLNGQVYLTGRVSSHVLDAFTGRRRKDGSPLASLSDRELEILHLIGQSQDTHQISDQLRVSPKTVDAHRSNIRRKLKLRNATELICYAARWVETQAKV